MGISKLGTIYGENGLALTLEELLYYGNMFQFEI